MTVGPHSTKLPQSWDTESDQLGVPASSDRYRNLVMQAVHGASSLLV